jgi:hypothetical protein
MNGNTMRNEESTTMMCNRLQFISYSNLMIRLWLKLYRESLSLIQYYTMPRGKLVAVDHVGGEQHEVVVGKEQVLSEPHTIRVVFHDFANLPHKRKLFQKSSAIWCHGYEWQLRLFPGGTTQSSEDEVYLSLFLHCLSAKSDVCEVKAKYTFRVPYTNYSNVCAACLFRESKPRGYADFLLRSDVLEPDLGHSVDGNLTIEVDIQVYKDASPFWEPKNELVLDMMKILESAD